MEKDIETWARGYIFERGGRLYKWTIPSVKGPPDDICLWPGRIVHFLEFKWDNEAPDPLQLLFHQELARFGHVVKIVRDRQWVIEYCRKYGRP